MISISRSFSGFAPLRLSRIATYIVRCFVQKCPQPRSLARALWRTFGREFLGILVDAHCIMPPKQPTKKSAIGSKDAGIVAYCHVCTLVHPEPVDQHCNIASPQDIAQFVLVNNLSVVDMGESSDSDIQSAQRQPSVTTEVPSGELPVTTGKDTTTSVVNIDSSNILSADHDMLSGNQSPLNVHQLHALLSCQQTNVPQSPLSIPNAQPVLQTPGPKTFVPLESPSQLRFSSQPPKRNVIYQVLTPKASSWALPLCTPRP